MLENCKKSQRQLQRMLMFLRQLRPRSLIIARTNQGYKATSMKISIHIEPQLGYTYNDIVTLAKAAEDSGFYRFTVSDHFFGPVEGHEMQ
jgi:hypothetical protein